MEWMTERKSHERIIQQCSTESTYNTVNFRDFRKNGHSMKTLNHREIMCNDCIPSGCSVSSNSSVIVSRYEHHLGAVPRAGTKYCSILGASLAKNRSPEVCIHKIL